MTAARVEAPQERASSAELARGRQIRQIVGDKARPTICFDRGGWSPKLFDELGLKGFEIITYRKGPATERPHEAFKAFTFTDGQGRTHDYLLADRRVSICYEGGTSPVRLPPDHPSR